MGRKRTRNSIPPGERYVLLHHWMLKSLAFRHLPGNAFKLMAVLALRYTGHNNGEIALSLRDAAREVGCSLNHATKLFRLLQSRGFIDVTQRGHFNLKTRHASTYKANWLPMRRTDHPGLMHEPTKEFMSWRPDESMNATQETQNTLSHRGTVSRTA